MLLTARAQREKVCEYVVDGNTAQWADAAFLAELAKGIRFNEADALHTGDGLFAGASGNPTVPT